MLNGTLKILGIVVLLLITLLLSGVLHIKEYRTVDEEFLKGLWDNQYDNLGGQNVSVQFAIKDKVYLTTHYRIVVR